MVINEGDKTSKAEMKERFSDKQEALLSAAWDRNSAELFTTFVQTLNCADINARTQEDKWTVMMIGCGLKKVESDHLKKLVDWGADLTLQDTDGWTALHWACHHKNEEAVKLICSLYHEKNNLLDIQSEDRMTPEDVAAKAGTLEIFKQYLEKIPEKTSDNKENTGKTNQSGENVTTNEGADILTDHASNLD
mmetsp:Transcript_38830/g.50218  ORF Transcript_38830/g.50218 Transcript_38830/m.50218 type:complete len:192 (+) Transcript_38830:1-576(+)